MSGRDQVVCLLVTVALGSACATERAVAPSADTKITAMCALLSMPYATAMDASALRSRADTLFGSVGSASLSARDRRILKADAALAVAGPPAAPSGAPSPLASLFAGDTGSVRATLTARAALADACR
jgi:hypothetical protein